MQAEERRRGLEVLIARAEGNPRAMAALSRLLRTDGWKAESAELAARARSLAPDDAEVRAISSEILSVDVPSWHFLIVKDQGRNDAYEDALRRAITPESRVLDIGSGTGLLALMAARLGAAHVYTCEMEPTVALAAREVIAHNGFSDRITVISKHSGEVDVAELGGPVDILVAEIVSNDMVTEDALPALEDAIPRLLKPNGAVIPATGEVRVALAYDARLERRRIGTVSGFDLSPFNKLAAPFYQIDVSSRQLALRSEPADLFDFDFESGGPWRDQTGRVDLPATGGPVNGIVQWISLGMDGTGRYDNQPGPEANSAWAALFHPLPKPFESRPGQICSVFGRHDRVSMRIWAEIGD